MPELPEVETVVRELKCLEGEVIDHLDPHWDKTLEGSSSEVIARLTSQKIKSVFRRGKYIAWELSGGQVLTIHLRMTGKTLFDCPEKDQKHLRLTCYFQSGLKLFFVDIRKFGRWKLWDSMELLLPKLGPEPLTSKAVKKALMGVKSSREIKKVLLDQHVLVGVGNIYADEALFASKIHPTLAASELSARQVSELAVHIPRILKASIDNMGTTLSDYRNTKNIGGENQHYLKVYGQTGEACECCGTTIEKIVIGGRGTHFCPECQR